MSTESVHLFDEGVPLDGSEACRDLLAFHAMADALVPSAKRTGAVLELRFSDRRLVSATCHVEGETEPVELGAGVGETRLDDVPRWPLYRIERSASATGSRLGGAAPDGFEPPIAREVAPFQYLGTLTPALAGLEWLPFDLHVTAPVLNFFSRLFVDYGDPLRPELLHHDEQHLDDIASEGDAFDEDELDAQRMIVRERHLVSSETSTWQVEDDTAGRIGIPRWTAGMDVPRCPVTGEPMRFVCDLNPGFLVDFVAGAPLDADEIARLMGPRLRMFADTGFHVFLHPESRVACYLVQLS